MAVSEVFLIALLIIFTLPYLFWRLCRTDYVAPLVVVQIVAGIILGPGILGAAFPAISAFLFAPPVMAALNGIAWWAVMLFVWVAGIELDVRQAWQRRGETALTAGLALAAPLCLAALVALPLAFADGWVGQAGRRWQFVLGVGMACAVTALPILVLFLEKLDLLRCPFGQRVLRYASVDDIALWSVLALILMDWQRVGRQLGFLLAFGLAATLLRRLMRWLPERDRWPVGLIALAGSGFAADWAGLHFMVGAFLSGAVLDSDWFPRQQMDWFRHSLLLALMPVFFLSTGLRTNWSLGGAQTFLVAAALLLAAVGGKLIGVHIAGRLLGWRRGEARVIGWLLQTKALIMIIFVNILLDRGVISSASFTALLLMAVASTMLTIPMVSAAKLDLSQ
jgi:Kef-type K+ transport system membrane component KefB